MEPKYQLNYFLEDCTKGISKVYVFRGAMETAKIDFNLKTPNQVLGFIGNRGLERPYFINSTTWENNPNLEKEIMVDAYGFFSGFNHGYVAFLFQPVTNMWNIKSFKKNRNSDPRNLLFEGLGKLLNQP